MVAVKPVYLLGYSCMCVLTTSAGCVTNDATVPANMPHEKCAKGRPCIAGHAARMELFI